MNMQYQLSVISHTPFQPSTRTSIADYFWAKEVFDKKSKKDSKKDCYTEDNGQCNYYYPVYREKA